MDEDLSAFVGEYYAGLMQGAKQIEDAAMSLKMLSMSPEERKKQELIQKEKEAFQAAQREKQAEKKRIMELSQQNRKVKQEEKVTEDARSNRLNFGANLVKFEPPKGGGG